MDINSYSYINYSGKENIIAQYETPDGDIITLSNNINYFQDKYFTVSATLDDNICFDMEYSDILTNYPTEKQARKQAIEYYNKCVPEKYRLLEV